MIDEREKINYAKRELESFRYLKSRNKYLIRQHEETMTKLENVKSPSAPKEIGGVYDPQSKARLYDKLNDINCELESNVDRIERIEKFLDQIHGMDKTTLYRVYIMHESQRRTLEDEAIARNMSRRALIYAIDELLKNF